MYNKEEGKNPYWLKVQKRMVNILEAEMWDKQFVGKKKIEPRIDRTRETQMMILSY